MVPTHLSGARVLIGESDPSTRARLHIALGAYGAEIAEVSTSRELMSVLVDQGPFDAVISDSTMPGSSCPELIAMARGAGLAVAFIVITRSTDDEVVAVELDRMLATPHGFDAAKCIFVPCEACGRPHVAELWPSTPSFCVRCIDAADVADPYIDYGGSD